MGCNPVIEVNKARFAFPSLKFLAAYLWAWLY